MYKKILVAVDLDHDSLTEDLLRVASDMAKAHGAKVHLLYVIAAGPAELANFMPVNYEKLASVKYEKKLAILAETLDLTGGNSGIAVRFGGSYQEILTHADKISADIIIVGCHKSKVDEYLLGSTASRIVRHATCSVLVVR